MKKQKLTPSNILLGLVFAFIFAFMLYCNIKTPMLVDDYDYCFSFADGTRITAFSQLFPSMAAHRMTMNGRLVPHFFLQLFLMLPMMLFNIANSAMFVAMLVLVYKLAFLNKTRPAWLRPFTACAVFAAIWVYQPAFGNVFLWEAGSVNYLWATVVALLYVYICLKSFYTGRDPETVSAKIAFLALSFVVGNFSETAAMASIGTVFLLSVQAFYFKKRKPSKLMIASFVLALAGFAILLSAPGEGAKIGAGLNAENILKNLNSVLHLCKSFWPLIAVTDILFVVAVSTKADEDTLFASANLVLIATAIMASLTIASYLPERVSTIPVVLLVAASAMLAVELFGKNTSLSLAVHTLPILMLPLFLVTGFIDILNTNYQLKMNEQEIIADAVVGKDVSYVEFLHADSKYSGLYTLLYIDEDPEMWPNASMAKYYGIDQIIGVK